MKYVFFGTPRFAEIILGRLIDGGLAPVAIVCNPDRPAGRKKIIAPPPAKRIVLERDPAIAVFQPETLDGKFAEKLSALAPDLFVVAAYAKIIPSSILRIPRCGTIGVHPSLLPAYRGASPIQSVILAGEPETGVTLYLMDEKVDHGPVLAQEKLPLDPLRTDYHALEEALGTFGGKMLLGALPRAVEGRLPAAAQDEARASYTKKFTTEDARIDEDDLKRAEAGDAARAAAITRKINAFSEEPGAWTVKDGARVKLLKAAVLDDGKLKLIIIQKEGERPLQA